MTLLAFVGFAVVAIFALWLIAVGIAAMYAGSFFGRVVGWYGVALVIGGLAIMSVAIKSSGITVSFA